jgi:hypothetical protein
MDAAGAADVERIIEQLEKSVREGRVELRFQHGPSLRAATPAAHAPAPGAPLPAPSAAVP